MPLHLIILHFLRKNYILTKKYLLDKYSALTYLCIVKQDKTILTQIALWHTLILKEW